LADAQNRAKREYLTALSKYFAGDESVTHKQMKDLAREYSQTLARTFDTRRRRRPRSGSTSPSPHLSRMTSGFALKPSAAKDMLDGVPLFSECPGRHGRMGRVEHVTGAY
jgi:hypothetical protein